MGSFFGPGTVTDELLTQRSSDQQLGAAAVPRVTWQWWQPLQQQQQQSSWEPVCLPSPGQPVLVVGTALTLRREGGSSGRISSEAHVESGATWSHLQESLCLLISHVYPLLQCWSQLAIRTITWMIFWIKRQIFIPICEEISKTSDKIRWDIPLLVPQRGSPSSSWNDGALFTTSPIQRWDGKR